MIEIRHYFNPYQALLSRLSSLAGRGDRSAAFGISSLFKSLIMSISRCWFVLLCLGFCPLYAIASVNKPMPRITGDWVVTLASKDTGIIKVPMHFAQDSSGEFSGQSRKGVLLSSLGLRRAVMARLFGGESFAGGALVNMRRGRIRTEQGVWVIEADLLFAGMGSYRFRGELSQSEFVGVAGNGQNPQIVSLAAARREGEADIRDFRTLASEIREAAHSRWYRPELLKDRVWSVFFADLERRFAQTTDDAQALLHFNQAARRLGVSHFALVGPAADMPVVSAGTKPAVEVSFPVAAVALLRIRHFNATSLAIRRAFEEIRASGVTQLIVDLRDNPGGDLSSMTVAAHLLETERSSGVFVGAGWWAQHEAAPDPSQVAGLPVLDKPDQDRFFELLASAGAFATRVVPMQPVFQGRVLVLTSKRTASAAEPLVDLLKNSGRATVIGETTAGRMLSSERVPLASGLELILPTADYFSAQGRRIEGQGVRPDVVSPAEQALDRALELARHSVAGPVPTEP